MELLPLGLGVMELYKKVNQELSGKQFLIPMSILEGNKYNSYVSKCTIKSVDLVENSVELVYEDNEEDDLWTTITLKEFDEHAEAI